MMRMSEYKSLIEVWEMKDSAYLDIKDMGLNEAIQTRINTSTATTLELGFNLSLPEKKTAIINKGARTAPNN